MIIQIGTEVDESRILWKYKESDEWERADIDDLICAYENRPTGGWIQNAPEGQGIDPPYICSICGHAESTRTPFCEQCGADMRGEKNETD